VPQSVIDGFTKETGIKVNYETYASNEEMLAKLVSGAQRYDLIQPSEYTIERSPRRRAQEIDWRRCRTSRTSASSTRPAARSAEAIVGAVDGRHGRHRREHRQGERRHQGLQGRVQEKYKGRSSCSTTRARS
jgi:hypothetical protein